MGFQGLNSQSSTIRGKVLGQNAWCRLLRTRIANWHAYKLHASSCRLLLPISCPVFEVCRLCAKRKTGMGKIMRWRQRHRKWCALHVGSWCHSKGILLHVNWNLHLLTLLRHLLTLLRHLLALLRHLLTLLHHVELH